MNRYVKALFGFALITAVFVAPTMATLGMIVMADCVLSDAQIARGESCTDLAEVAVWPTLIIATIVFVLVQAIFLRWALRRKP